MDRLNAAISVCNAKGSLAAQEYTKDIQEGKGAWPEPQPYSQPQSQP